MAVGFVARFAARSPVPVFCLENTAGVRLSRKLRLDDRIRLVRSPRHASVLLVSGEVPPDLEQAARNVHDQVPAPRGVLLWYSGENATLFSGSGVLTCRSEQPVSALVELYRALLEGSRDSTRLFGPRENPMSWRGEGDHGQGGKGMMGGIPYGRAMGMTGEDIRDGLQLGLTTVTVGPYLPWMPPGLRLRLSLQGDVIQELECLVAGVNRADDIFSRVLAEPVTVAELELARARHHLETLADLLFLLELCNFGRRALLLAGNLTAGRTGPLRRFASALKRTGFYVWSTGDIGHLDQEALSGCGPAARAAGLKEDGRLEDPAYRKLDFRVVHGRGSGAAALCSQRLEEVVQSLELAARAGGRIREPGAPLEGPRGIVCKQRSRRPLDFLEQQAQGMSWDNFVTLLASFDLDCSSLPPSENFNEADRFKHETGENEGHEHDHHGEHDKDGATMNQG